MAAPKVIPGRKCGDCGRAGQKFSSKLFAICVVCERWRRDAAGPGVRVLRAHVARGAAPKRTQPHNPKHRRPTCQRCGTTTSMRGFRLRAEMCLECLERVLLSHREDEIARVAVEMGGDPTAWAVRYAELFQLERRRAQSVDDPLPRFTERQRCPRTTCSAPPRRIDIRACRCGTANGICEAIGIQHVHKKCQNCTYEWLERPEGE